MFFIKLTLLKIKRMLRFLPGVMAGALALCFIMGVFAFGANNFLYKDREVQKQQIGIVRPENDKYIDIVVGMVKNIDSVAAISDFKYVDDENKAYKMLNSGELDAAVILPYRFIQDIVHGKNTPAKVVMPKNSEMYSSIFKELADNGINMLADVQAAIQGAFYATEGDNHIALNEKTEDFNLMFFDLFMSREKMFKENSLSAVGSLSLVEYYGIMAAATLMLLCGMCLSFVSDADNSALADVLKRRGIGKIAISISNNITIFVFYTLLMAVIVGGAYLTGVDFRLDIKAILLAVIIIAAIVNAVYSIFSPWTGALILFAVTLAAAFIGGAVLPAPFLPKALAELTVYSPIYVVFDCLANVFREEFAFNSFKIYLATMGIIYAVVFAVQISREVAEV